MKNEQIVVAIFLGIGLVFVSISWFVDSPILGLVGYTALCCGNGLSLRKAIIEGKRQNKQNSTKDNLNR